MSNLVESTGPSSETVILDSSHNVVVSIPVNTVITSSKSDTVTTDISTTNVVVLGGSQGPPGVSEDAMIYAKQTDFASDTVIYRGEAAVGSLTSEPIWRIRKIILAVDGDVSETWASGNANFDKIWDNRDSLIYI